MKEFNLEEAKSGKPVCTMRGRPVRLFCFDRKSEEGYHILGLVYFEENRSEEIKTWTLDGSYEKPSNAHIYNLFMAEETIEINGHKVPKPETEAPEYNTTYFFLAPESEHLYYSYEWHDTPSERRALKRGLIHLVEENAIKHAEALLSFTETKG